jgi:DNA-binding NarL/FixJ family response regulator
VGRAAVSQVSSAAGRLRRATAHALLADGLRVKQIAYVLGVSHQRISRQRCVRALTRLLDISRLEI